MSAQCPAQCLLASALLAALGASACVDAVVVGTQRSPISAHDASDDASTPWPDAAEPDAQPEPDAAPDADATPEDAGTPPLDAALDDGGSTAVDAGADADAGCSALECAPEAGPLTPCSSCDVTVITIYTMDERFGDLCPGGLEPLCWQNPDDTCSVQCPPTTTCGASSDCAPDAYCYFPKSDCGETSRGWCAQRPQGDCTGAGNRVCGCDGMIYETGCHALRAGVQVAGPGYEGRCPPVLEF